MKLFFKRLACLIIIIFASFLFCQPAYATATYTADLKLMIDNFNPTTKLISCDDIGMSWDGAGVNDEDVSTWYSNEDFRDEHWSALGGKSSGFAGDGVNNGFSYGEGGTYLVRGFTTTESSVELSFDFSGDYTLGISRDYSAFEEAFALVRWDLLIDGVSSFRDIQQIAYSHTEGPDVQGPDTFHFAQTINKTIAQAGNHTIRLEGYVFGEASANYSPVPEPSTIFLLGFGLVGLAGVRFRKKR